MRWTREAPKRRTAQPAYGEAVWSWRPDAGAKLAMMLRITPTMGAKEPGPQGERENKPLKPSRGECRVFSGVTVVTNARAFYTTRAAAGASGARHSLRPLIIRRQGILIDLALDMRRDREAVSRTTSSAVIIRESG